MIEQHIMFIRHGETVASQEHIAHGQRDSLLNDRGQEQARSIGKRLLNWPIPYHRIVSSPLSRARNTAELINRALHLPLNTDPGLIECDLGDWEGISYEELGKHRYAERSIADDHFAEHNGESPAVISARLSHTIERLRCLHPTDNIVLVSHGAAFCHAIAALIGSKPLFGYQYLMHNAALSELKLSPEPEIIRLNDYQHLPSHLQSVNKRQAQSQNV